ncbi:MAG: hypothetical protein L0Y68_03875 [Candidatus Dadabacteria bacterium]|nr:hypothetical protein [Candidatus Dadabacteria bacterium]
MKKETRPKFLGGGNIAIKVPPHQFESTIVFCRDIIGLKQLDQVGQSVVFEFGMNRLWIDNVSSISQAEIWLELKTPDTAQAAAYLRENGVTRCDEIENLPEGFKGFCISSPASIIHLVASDEQT